MESKFGKLQSTQIKDRYGTVYGVAPATKLEVQSKINIILEELEKKDWKSGYLKSKFG